MVAFIVAGALVTTVSGVATAASPVQTCASFGQAGDDLSGHEDGDYSPIVADPATVVVSNPNVLPESVTITPEGGTPLTATLGPSFYHGSHTFQLPSPGSLSTPSEHKFGVKVNGVPGGGGTSSQLIGFVKSKLCTYQRDVTATQVEGTGVVPSGGTGSIGFKIHLSGEAPPTGGRDNPHEFVVTATEQDPAGKADLAHPITGSVTIPSGSTDASLTLPVSTDANSSQPLHLAFLLTGNDNHVPSPVLVQGTVTPTGSAAPAPTSTTPAQQSRGSALSEGQRLAADEQLVSPNGRYRLLMQADGNLVEYSGSRAVWTSRTPNHPGSDFEAQADGNFVVYAPGHTAIWASGTRGHPNSVLRMQDDGSAVIYASGNIPVWSSTTAR